MEPRLEVLTKCHKARLFSEYLYRILLFQIKCLTIVREFLYANNIQGFMVLSKQNTVVARSATVSFTTFTLTTLVESHRALPTCGASLSQLERPFYT